jgi:hypothetical protein
MQIEFQSFKFSEKGKINGRKCLNREESKQKYVLHLTANNEDASRRRQAQLQRLKERTCCWNKIHENFGKN